MITIFWSPTLSFPHAWDANEVYRWDWSDWLDGETLTDVDVSSTVLSSEVVSSTSSTSDIRVSGGTLGQVGQLATVTVVATSSGNRVQSRTVRYRVQKR